MTDRTFLRLVTKKESVRSGTEIKLARGLEQGSLFCLFSLSLLLFLVQLLYSRQYDTK
jgi:hypothetical protein